MHLMVYAAYGRTGIAMMQAYCRRLGIDASGAEIEDLLAVLKELPTRTSLGLPTAQIARLSPSGCAGRRAVEPQGTRLYRSPGVRPPGELRIGLRALAAAGALYAPVRRDRNHAAWNQACATAPGMQQYAAVELFRGTITHHSFVAHHQDHACRIAADPLRRRGLAALCTDSPSRCHLCPAAIAPRRCCRTYQPGTHRYRPRESCDVHEKRLFDAIDGKRTISEILDNPPTSKGRRRHIQRGRAFFQRLWWYDHVVFDASR